MTATGAFSRAASRLFAHLGEEAVFRGVPLRVIVSDDVELLGAHGEVAQTVTTAALPAGLAPTLGESLSFRGRSWALDQLLRRDATQAEYVVRPA